MTLSVHVLGREVGILEALGDFKSSMRYHEGVAADDFVSLTMRVRRDRTGLARGARGGEGRWFRPGSS